jgi:acetylglutamate kinase
LGLSGADGNLIKAKKRPVNDIDYGYVGDLDENSIQTENLDKLITNGFVPVFSAITHDGESQLLNTNADTIASALAVAMSNIYETSLVYCFEKKGVLMDVNDENSLIREINPTKYQDLIAKGIIADGMLPKLHNAFEAINKGVKEVFIGKADDLNELESSGLLGTRLIKITPRSVSSQTETIILKKR